MTRAFASIKRGLQQAARHRAGKRVAGLRLHSTTGPGKKTAARRRRRKNVVRP